MATLNIDNNNVIELQDLTNVATGAVDTTATVTMTLKDRNNVDVVGQAWPLTLSHVSAGLYRGTLNASLSLVEKTTYVAHIDVVGSGGEIGHWEVPYRAVERTS